MSDGDDVPIPPSLIRLATSLHQYNAGSIDSANKLTFSKSFKSSGMHHPATSSLLRTLDSNRVDLATSLTSKDAAGVEGNATRYLPSIRRLLLSCEVQPDTAVLDTKLNFQWRGALEGDGPGGTCGKVRSSQALMFEVSMTISSIAIAHASLGCSSSQTGDFASSVTNFKKAASIMDYMHTKHLPQWVSLGSSTSEGDLPIECTSGGCAGFSRVFLAHAQQMAIAKALQGDTINFGLVAKLCKGVQGEIDEFVKMLRKDAAVHYCRLPPPYLKYIAFQIALQEALTMYFNARATWNKGSEFGLALAMMYDARSMLEVRASVTSRGIPEDIENSNSALYVLRGELVNFRSHVDKIVEGWKRDVDTVYFDKIPNTVPVASVLKKGMVMMKVEPWSHSSLGDPEPVPLSVQAPAPPGGEDYSAPPPTAPGIERTDSDLARELQAKLNAGEDV
mmetsp:Transcript_2757/g.5049  ORF Transcript_2757/g.5049 Transcript_2757/m.5049 type:complete len:449 (+) Transcript_2757:42-1388(+)|eukprot:CAMPEP_0182506662 /NCGR_PEP_ID=MMETSP1321-20130603/21696_1 /TAXON_ID=91990 /ORGANISM="Bolidomonas sp., Strain RCC1657" /LENGTH=448 /DNA_ID=CAMNT_0024712439 /DNA_START=110 /DNA_END=1456 /DNA_ORIENTATION=-